MPLILLNKPHNVLCQFTDSRGRMTLADFVDTSSVYPAGRLDNASEGLVLLTDDGRLQARIAQPRSKQPKGYWVQVEGDPDTTALQSLLDGIELKDGLAKAVSVDVIDEPPNLWPRNPPVRTRKSVADGWLDITVAEGRNRQIRRMTAAAGLPTLRLIRYRVAVWTLDDLAPGRSREISTRTAWRQIKSAGFGPLR